MSNMSIKNAQNGVAVTFLNVTVTSGETTILDSVSAQVPRGSCTAIVGPNGAGKTTLLLALLGEVAYNGEIEISSSQSRDLRIGYVPQRLQFDRGIPLTVLEFMVMGWQRSPLFFGIRKIYRDRAMEYLSSVQLDGIGKRKIGALSGGEMQRLLLALALGQEPDLLVLDEPSSGVDFHGEQVFCELLDLLRFQHGFTQLMVSHDLPTVTHHATHVICLNHRVAAEGPPREALTVESLTKTFGLHMGLVDSSAFPHGDRLCSSPCCVERYKS